MPGPAAIPFVESVLRQLTQLLGGDPGRGLLAVSGGADSVALLRALASFLPPESLGVAHLNHQLRGEAAVADADFVAQLAATHRLRTHLEVTDLTRQAGDSSSVEARGRQARYQFFERLAAEHGYAWVATAHHADDQAETVLHRLLRGTGLDGLRGIAARRPLGGAVLVRPLLPVTRAEIRQYLQQIGQPHRDDASNHDLTPTRNRLRHEVLPLLESFNPHLIHSLRELAADAAEVFTTLESLTLQLLRAGELPRAGEGCRLRAEFLQDQSAADVQRLLRLLWRREGWPQRSLTRQHWEAMAAVCRGEAVATDLPDGIRVSRRGGVISLGPRGRAGTPPPAGPS